MTPFIRTPSLALILIFFAAVAYCLPWVINPGVSLTLGGYDLAEWTSLHPAVRGSSPALLTTLLLRLPLVCLGITIALIAFPHRPGLRLALALLAAASLLPPLEFLTQATGDPNYQQQFVLALLVAGISVLLVSIRLNGLQKPLMIVVAIIGIVSSLIGLLQAYQLMETFALPVQIGMGGIFSAVIFGVLGILMVTNGRGNKQGSPPS